MLIIISVAAALVLGAGAGAAVFLGVIPTGSSAKADDAHGGKSKDHGKGDHGDKGGHGGKDGHGGKGGGDYGGGYAIEEIGEVAFVTLDPLIVSLGASGSARHLKLTLSIEAYADATESVEVMLPRVRDVLNTYLRAVEVRDLEDPAAMARLRAQMARRVRMVTPPESVRDVLILEFVLN